MYRIQWKETKETKARRPDESASVREHRADRGGGEEMTDFVQAPFSQVLVYQSRSLPLIIFL